MKGRSWGPRRHRNVALQAESRARPRRRDLRATTTDHDHASPERSRPRRVADSIAIPLRAHGELDRAGARRHTSSLTSSRTRLVRARRRDSCARDLEMRRGLPEPPPRSAPRRRWGRRIAAAVGEGGGTVAGAGARRGLVLLLTRERPERFAESLDTSRRTPRRTFPRRAWAKHTRGTGARRAARAGETLAHASTLTAQAAGLEPISARFSALACGLVSSSSGSSASSSTSRMSSTSTISI